MNRILRVDLSQGTVHYTPHVIRTLNDCGRALALKILKEIVPPGADYLDAENAVVITPGLLSGTHAPSTGRFTVAAKQGRTGLRSVNLAGPFANRLAYLDIAAVCITGRTEGQVILKIDEAGAKLVSAPELASATVSEVIEHVRRRFGAETAIVGIGPAGERIMALSSIFSTYPVGEPRYYCVRGGMGDVMGIKGLKAVAVTTSREFAKEMDDKIAFNHASRELTTLMREHPVCGKALPAYGSITLMRMLKEGRSFGQMEPEKHSAESLTRETPATVPQPKINRACSVNCPIGCLNRHETGGSSPFNSPFDSEAFAACEKLFGIDDQAFVIGLNKQCFEEGLDSIEFLFSCAMMLKISNEKDIKAGLLRLLDELKNATPRGRILGSTSRGIYGLYAEFSELKPMVTRAATSEQSRFDIRMPNRISGLESLSDLEYLYAYILAAQNIGMCLFTTFAVLDKPQGLQLMADMVNARTGMAVDPVTILKSGYNAMIDEREYEMESMKAGALANIPEFVKVLYRYFGSERNG